MYGMMDDVNATCNRVAAVSRDHVDGVYISEMIMKGIPNVMALIAIRAMESAAYFLVLSEYVSLGRKQGSTRAVLMATRSGWGSIEAAFLQL